MTQQFYYRIYTPQSWKLGLKDIFEHPCSRHHCSWSLKRGTTQGSIQGWMEKQHGHIDTQLHIIHPQKLRIFCDMIQHGWTFRTINQSQKYRPCVTPLIWHSWNGQIQRDGQQMQWSGVGAEEWEWPMSGDKASVLWGDKSCEDALCWWLHHHVTLVNTLKMRLMKLTCWMMCTQKNGQDGKFHIMCVLSQ